MGSNIDCYLDLSSLYSYFCITYLLKNRETLESHDVNVNFIPVFLGGINVGSGNKPPWSLPAKAAYGKYDAERAKEYHGLEKIETPDFFPPLTILPLRALCFIKSAYPTSTFENVWAQLFKAMWIPPQSNVTVPGPLAEALLRSNLFSQSDVDQVMAKAADKEWKDKLSSNTKDALNRGAFGAPWMWVTNSKGVTEPFFGSDRFHFMWEFLGLPWSDLEVLPRKESKL